MRARAITAVEATRATELMDDVLPLLGDSASEVRHAAAKALMASGNPKYMNAFWDLLGDATSGASRGCLRRTPPSSVTPPRGSFTTPR